MRRFVVGVMGPGEAADEAAIRAARALGRLIASEGWVVLSGGRDAGVMRAVNRGAKEVAGSLTVGVLPSAQAPVSPDVDIVIVTEMQSARNNINVLSSDVVVACGNAGPGTASEIALALKARKPVVLLAADPDTAAYFSRLGGDRVSLAQTPQDAIAVIKRLRESPEV